MAFDLTNVYNNAKTVVSKADGSSGDTPKYRYLYPSTGTLKVRFLYNPKSGTFGRLTKKHTINEARAVCLDMYGMDCPICKVVTNIKNATGQDIWRFNSRVRAISFVQYVGSNNYSWTQENPEPKVGDIVILMYPWSVYQDINRLIVNAGSNASQIIATNVGKAINISKWQEKGMTKYKAEIDAFSSEFTSCNSSEEFESMLLGLPDLNEVNCPSTVTDEIIANTRETANTLSREYLSVLNKSEAVSVSNGFNAQPINSGYVQPVQQQQFSNTPVQQGYQTRQPQQVQPMAQKQQVNAPSYACIGNYDDNSPKCMACLKAVPCQMVSDNQSDMTVPF